MHDLVLSRIPCPFFTAGTVNVFAGSILNGLIDGPATSAKFDGPRGVAIDSAGVFYITDQNNVAIRMIATNLVVTTISSLQLGASNGFDTNAGFSTPYLISVDTDNNLFFADGGNHVIRRVNLGGFQNTG